MSSTYRFVAGWTLLITIMLLANKNRLGHVIIYYSLLLMIIFILVAEYKQIAPLLNPMTISELNAASGQGSL
jgi:hypothetical protein